MTAASDGRIKTQSPGLREKTWQRLDRLSGHKPNKRTLREDLSPSWGSDYTLGSGVEASLHC